MAGDRKGRTSSIESGRRSARRQVAARRAGRLLTNAENFLGEHNELPQLGIRNRKRSLGLKRR